MKKLKEEKQITRAAIYCRVSTSMQGEAEYSSLDAQEDQLKAYCKGRGWEVIKVYKDIKSGKDLERDEIQNLLRDAEEDIFDIVVSTKIDRFSRRIVDFYELIEKLSALNVDLASATQPIDTSSSIGWLMLDIMGAMLPPDERLIEELQTPTYEVKDGKIRIMKKDTMKDLIKRSPDKADALCLTFADQPELVYSM